MRFFFLPLLIFFLFPKPCHAESWAAKDKFIHITVSFTIGALVHHLIDKNTNCTEDEARALTFFSTLGIGALKECLDEEFSWKDLGADAVGAGLAATIKF